MGDRLNSKISSLFCSQPPVKFGDFGTDVVFCYPTPSEILVANCYQSRCGLAAEQH